MATGFSVRSLAVTGVTVVASLVAAAVPSAQAPLAVDSAKVTIAGTSNIHEYTASTTSVRITRAQLGAGAAGEAFCDNALKPGVVEAFEVAIPSASLTSPKEGLDKNMHKALKVQEFPDITFRLVRFEMVNGAPDRARAFGVLRIAGVEREVALDITTRHSGSTLTVQGRLDLLMTDYGIKPPTAMLGMLKTDPKVKVTFETVLAVPLT